MIPINSLHEVGVIKDTPAVSLPPNAFTDARNVRFRDGAVIKMEGEHSVFTGLTDIRYVIWWPNPNRADNMSGYYIIIQDNGTNDVAYLYQPADEGQAFKAVDNTVPVSQQQPVVIGTFTREGNWQHTFFQGGFAVVLNNGLDVPHYILDSDGNDDIQEVPDFAELPGWESYNVNEVILNDTFDMNVHSPVFDLGQLVDFTVNSVVITIGDGDPDTYTGNVTDDTTGETQVDIETDTATNTTIVRFDTPADIDGQTIHVAIRSQNEVTVRSGVVRSFGDVLVAGNLVERDGTEVVRNLPGVVRVSDVAIPGAIPNNWNPFAAGVSTADEFTLSNTGIVQDMAELQGNLYIYNTSGISVLRRSGNAQVPWSTDTISDSWGCQTTNGVVEFDGKHLVIGSHDIYLFGGHPGSIQSVADGRVRDFFFTSLSQRFAENLFTVRYQRRDEIWICYPDSGSVNGECTTSLIWNYRLNNWTQRDLNAVHSGVVAPVPGAGIPTVTITVAGTPSTDDGLPFAEWYLDAVGVVPTETFELNSESVPMSQILDPDITVAAEGTAAVDYGDEDFIPLSMTVATEAANVDEAWGFTLDNVGAEGFNPFDVAEVTTGGIHTTIRPEILNPQGDVHEVLHYGFLGINNEQAALRVGEDSLDHIYFEGIARGGRDMFIGFIECDEDGNVAADARQFLVDVRNEGNPKLRGDWQ